MANIEFLRECGIQEWVLDGDENFKSFFTWFNYNITSANILTDEELVARNELIKSNDYYTDDELKTEKAKITEQYEGIWTNTNRDMVKLERELEQLSLQEEWYEDFASKMKSVHSQTIEDLTLINNELKLYEKSEEKCIEECVKATETLQEINIATQMKIHELSQLYTKAQKYPLFTHQMSLDQYLQKCDQFTKCADIYIQKIIKVQDGSDDENEARDIEIAAIAADIEEVVNRLYTANFALHMEKANTFAQKRLVDYLGSQDWLPTSTNAMKTEVERLKNRIAQEYSLTLETLSNRMGTQLNQIAVQQGEMVIYENNREKYDRAKKRLAHLKKFVDIVADGMMNAECIWILMQLDLERAKKRNNFDTKWEENRLEMQICNRRNDVMKAIGASNANDLLVDHFVEQLRSIFDQQKSGCLQSNENAIIDVLAASDVFKSSLLECLNQILSKKSYQPIVTFTMEINNTKADLLRFLMDGPVNNYQYWCIDFVKKRKRLELKVAELEKQTEYYKDEFRQFCNNYNEKAFWRQKQILWIWFLTEPQKVLKAIKGISAEAQSHSKPLLAKPVAGLLRK